MSTKVTVIEPTQKVSRFWTDVWQYRGLFYFLAWRDVKVRYKQAAIGVAWSVLRPLIMMTIMWLVFGKVAKLPSGNVPYPLFVFAAMLPWQFFAGALSESSNSLVGNANMITKVFFPRVIVPTSSIIVSLVDFCISAVLLTILMVAYGVAPSIKIFVLPVFVALGFISALGAGLWLSALTVKYRDFRFIVPFIIQTGLYASPVGYASSLVPEKWRALYGINPMVGVIDGFRWAIFGGEHQLHLASLAVSAVAATILFIIGFSYFRKTERTFADVI